MPGAGTVSARNEHHLRVTQKVILEGEFHMTNHDQKQNQDQKSAQQNQGGQQSGRQQAGQSKQNPGQQSQSPGQQSAQHKPGQQGDNAAPQNQK